jgi:putative ABC transport system permease protein
VFSLRNPYAVVTVLLLMLAVAAATAADRVPVDRSSRKRLRLICALGILLGSGLTLVYVGAVVIHVRPWYDPRYLIPLFGMIVANAMNGATLAAERLQAEIQAGRAEIEAYLALGASSRQATAEPARRALIAALMPTINALSVVGIVSLPGMMTGQILAGSPPEQAVRYQIVVMFMLTGATALTSAAVVLWYRRTFFSAAEQLLQQPR